MRGLPLAQKVLKSESMLCNHTNVGHRFKAHTHVTAYLAHNGVKTR